MSPVHLDPPDLPVGEAAMLTSTKPGTGATLLELSHLGVLQVQDEDTKPPIVILKDATLAVHTHQRALLKGLFPLLKPGESRVLRRGRKENTRLVRAQAASQEALHRQLAERGCYSWMPTKRLRRRSTAGRRLTAEVGALKTAMTTVEAGQLTLADLEQLLPWAFLFGLDDQWERLRTSVEDEPGWPSAPGRFELGKFRLALAAFTSGTLPREYQKSRNDGTLDDDMRHIWGPDAGNTGTSGI